MTTTGTSTEPRYAWGRRGRHRRPRPRKVLLAAGGVVLAASRHRRDPFTLSCAGLCVLLAGTTVVRDADWIVVLCLLAGAALCIAGVTRFRTVPGLLLSGLSWPLAGLRGMPWLGRTVSVLTGIGLALARWGERLHTVRDGRLVNVLTRWMPAATAGAILTIGLGMATFSVTGLLAIAG